MHLRCSAAPAIQRRFDDVTGRATSILGSQVVVPEGQGRPPNAAAYSALAADQVGREDSVCGLEIPTEPSRICEAPAQSDLFDRNPWLAQKVRARSL